MAGVEPLAIVAIAVAVVLILLVAVRTITRDLFGGQRSAERTVELYVLEQRLARGEITQQEFDEAKRTLGG